MDTGGSGGVGFEQTEEPFGGERNRWIGIKSASGCSTWTATVVPGRLVESGVLKDFPEALEQLHGPDPFFFR